MIARRRYLGLVMLAAAFVLLILPFTESGTRLLLNAAARMSPLTIEYGGGTLAGKLQLTRLALADKDFELELLDVMAELAPACLWRSAVCLRQLQVRRFEMSLLPDPGDASSPSADPTAAGDGGQLQIPVQVEIAWLRVDSSRFQWENGQWEMGALEASVSLGGPRVLVDSASIIDGRLQLLDAAQASAENSDPLVLPQIDLPLQLLVDEMVLENPSWDAYGAQGQLQELALAGGWRGSELQLDRLRLRSEQWGRASLAATLQFSGTWPLELEAELVPAEIPHWPGLLNRQLSLEAGGDLTALALRARHIGSVDLVAVGEVNTLDPELPFRLRLDADWAGALAPGELVELPAALADLTLAAPAQLVAQGSLNEQFLQLQATASGLGYESVALLLAAHHDDQVVTVEELRLQDLTAENTLWGSGELRLGEAVEGFLPEPAEGSSPEPAEGSSPEPAEGSPQNLAEGSPQNLAEGSSPKPAEGSSAQPLQWQLELESSGVDLPRISETFSGRLRGQLRASGRNAGSDWQVTIGEVDLQGTVNELPATISGYAGLGAGRVVARSDLRARVNGAVLAFTAAGTGAQPGRFELSVEDLGRWRPATRGELSLQGEIASGWRQLDFSGSLRKLELAGIQIAGGELEGEYRPAAGQAFKLGLSLSELQLGELALDSLGLEAAGTARSQTLQISSQGEVQANLRLSGTVGQNREWSGELAPAALHTPQGSWRLDEPVTMTGSADSGELRIAGHCWRSQWSQVCPGDLLLGERGSGSLTVEGGMEYLALFLPDELQLRGDLQSRWTASWEPGSAVLLDGKLLARKLEVTRQFGADEATSISWNRVEAALRNDGQGLRIDAEMGGNGDRELQANLLLPADRQLPLQGDLVFESLQLSTLSPLAPNLSAFEGAMSGRLQIAGTVDQPLASGTLSLSAGRFALVGNPTEVSDLELVLQAQGDRADISGRGLLGAGPLDISGQLLSLPEPRLELSLTGDKHQILLPPATQLAVSQQLELLATGGRLDLSGRVIVHEGTLEPEELPAGTIALSADVVEVDDSGRAITESRPFDTRIRLRLLIEDKFRLLGQMVDATLGGELQVSQEPAQAMQLFGNLNVIGGELRAFGQLLRIKRGTVSFGGPPDNPGFDVRAQRTIGREDVVVGVHLRGTLQQPQLEVFSDPLMSQGDTMSYLVRGRGMDVGAGTDATAMAISVGAGAVNRSPLVTELNRIPGVNNIQFSAEGTDEEVAATVGGYVGNRLYLSYGMGVYEPINVLTARLYLQTRLWLEVVSRLENSVDLYYSFDLD